MIKRDGIDITNTNRNSGNNPNVRLMNARTKNVSIAKETIAITAQKKYTTPSGQMVDISQAVDNCLEKTVLYAPYANLPDTDWETCTPTIEVNNETTAQAAVRLLQAGKQDIVALNFASARNQGGGFLAGAVAQEEDLCRASALYASLKSKPIFYNENILCDDALYTDNVIYSPNVPFFRREHNLLLEEPFTLSIVSSPAPNVHAMGVEDLEHEDFDMVIYSTMLHRMTRFLNIAAAHGHQTIILGGWGCGAFGNDPGQVASAFHEALRKVPAFKHVCFAVYDVREPPVVYESFKEIFLAQPGTSIL